MSNSAPEATFIAPHTFIKGELHLSGPTTIAGRVEGSILSQDQLEIAADGITEGEIQGSIIDIHGSVTGNIVASRACRLGPTAKVNGELRAANLSISEGACFVGKVYVGGANVEQEIAAEAPVSTPAPVSVANRMEKLAAEAEELATIAGTTASPSGPTIRINSQAVQQMVQQTAPCAPRIIRARG